MKALDIWHMICDRRLLIAHFLLLFLIFVYPLLRLMYKLCLVDYFFFFSSCLLSYHDDAGSLLPDYLSNTCLNINK